MATQLNRIDSPAGVRRLIASEVGAALARETGLGKNAASNTAQIVAAVAATLIALPADQLKLVKANSARIGEMITALAHGEAPDQFISIPAPTAVEPRKGSGLGEVIAVEDGRSQLAAFATATPIEQWAGPVAGSTELTAMGIARSTLHEWQKQGQVIGLLAGARKHVFPTEQFIDGRPVKGLADVLTIAESPRRAWHWLVQASPLLDGKRPVDLLKVDRVTSVVDAARTVFDSP